MKKRILGLLFISFMGLLFADTTEAELEAENKKLQATLKEKKEAKAQESVTPVSAVKKSQTGYFYIGYDIAGGGGTYTQKRTVSGGNTTATETELTAGMGTLKFGYSNASNNRWELSFSGIGTQRINKIEDTLSGMDINWFAVFDLEKSKLSPYFYIGLGGYTWETPNTSITTNELSGGAFNLGFGAVYDMSGSFEFEFAYRLKFIGWEEYILGNDIYNEGHALGFLAIGLNYHF